MSTQRQFKPIAGVSASDDEIAAFAARKGMPTMQAANVVPIAPAAIPPVVEAPKAVAAPTVRISLDLPEYLADQVRDKAHKARCSTRHILMLALKDARFEIADADMVPDGRKVR